MSKNLGFQKVSSKITYKSKSKDYHQSHRTITKVIGSQNHMSMIKVRGLKTFKEQVTGHLIEDIRRQTVNR